MNTENREEQKPHSLNIDNRHRCCLTGIKKVVSASESNITMISYCGTLSVLGNNLKLTAFSESGGTVSFTGEINTIKYGEKTSPLKKIFR